MLDKRVRSIEYMCSYCGSKQTRGVNSGRPMPGTCRRRQNNQPHRWIINRKIM